MTQHGTCGLLGANEGRLIAFHPLWQTLFNFWLTSSIWERSTVQLTRTNPWYLRLILPFMELLLVSIQLSADSCKVFNSRPPCPRYSFYLGIGAIITEECVFKLGDTNGLIDRSSDLHALDLDFCHFTPESVVFILPTLEGRDLQKNSILKTIDCVLCTHLWRGDPRFKTKLMEKTIFLYLSEGHTNQ